MKILRSVNKISKVRKKKEISKVNRFTINNFDYIATIKDENPRNTMDDNFDKFRLIMRRLSSKKSEEDLIEKIKKLEFSNSEATTMRITNILVNKAFIIRDDNTSDRNLRFDSKRYTTGTI